MVPPSPPPRKRPEPPPGGAEPSRPAKTPRVNPPPATSNSAPLQHGAASVSHASGMTVRDLVTVVGSLRTALRDLLPRAPNLVCAPEAPLDERHWGNLVSQIFAVPHAKLDRPVVVIGCEPRCHVRLGDVDGPQTVARVVYAGSHAFVEPMSSLQVRVNGVVVSRGARTMFRPGDFIFFEIGIRSFCYVLQLLRDPRTGEVVEAAAALDTMSASVPADITASPKVVVVESSGPDGAPVDRPSVPIASTDDDKEAGSSSLPVAQSNVVEVANDPEAMADVDRVEPVAASHTEDIPESALTIPDGNGGTVSVSVVVDDASGTRPAGGEAASLGSAPLTFGQLAEGARTSTGSQLRSALGGGPINGKGASASLNEGDDIGLFSMHIGPQMVTVNHKKPRSLADIAGSCSGEKRSSRADRESWPPRKRQSAFCRQDGCDVPDDSSAQGKKISPAPQNAAIKWPNPTSNPSSSAAGIPTQAPPKEQPAKAVSFGRVTIVGTDGNVRSEPLPLDKPSASGLRALKKSLNSQSTPAVMKKFARLQQKRVSSIANAVGKAVDTLFDESFFSPSDNSTTFENFPYSYLQDEFRDFLLTWSYVHLVRPDIKRERLLEDISSPNLLLAGANGTELYLEHVARAIASRYKADLLVMDVEKIAKMALEMRAPTGLIDDEAASEANDETILPSPGDGDPGSSSAPTLQGLSVSKPPKLKKAPRSVLKRVSVVVQGQTERLGSQVDGATPSGEPSSSESKGEITDGVEPSGTEEHASGSVTAMDGVSGACALVDADRAMPSRLNVDEAAGPSSHLPLGAASSEAVTQRAPAPDCQPSTSILQLPQNSPRKVADPRLSSGSASLAVPRDAVCVKGASETKRVDPLAADQPSGEVGESSEEKGDIVPEAASSSSGASIIVNAATREQNGKSETDQKAGDGNFKPGDWVVYVGPESKTAMPLSTVDSSPGTGPNGSSADLLTGSFHALRQSKHRSSRKLPARRSLTIMDPPALATVVGDPRLGSVGTDSVASRQNGENGRYVSQGHSYGDPYSPANRRHRLAASRTLRPGREWRDALESRVPGPSHSQFVKGVFKGPRRASVGRSRGPGFPELHDRTGRGEGLQLGDSGQIVRTFSHDKSHAVVSFDHSPGENGRTGESESKQTFMCQTAHLLLLGSAPPSTAPELFSSFLARVGKERKSRGSNPLVVCIRDVDKVLSLLDAKDPAMLRQLESGLKELGDGVLLVGTTVPSDIRSGVSVPGSRTRTHSFSSLGDASSERGPLVFGRDRDKGGPPSIQHFLVRQAAVDNANAAANDRSGGDGKPWSFTGRSRPSSSMFDSSLIDHLYHMEDRLDRLFDSSAKGSRPGTSIFSARISVETPPLDSLLHVEWKKEIEADKRKLRMQVNKASFEALFQRFHLTCPSIGNVKELSERVMGVKEVEKIVALSVSSEIMASSEKTLGVTPDTSNGETPASAPAESAAEKTADLQPKNCPVSDIVPEPADVSEIVPVRNEGKVEAVATPDKSSDRMEDVGGVQQDSKSPNNGEAPQRVLKEMVISAPALATSVKLVKAVDQRSGGVSDSKPWTSQALKNISTDNDFERKLLGDVVPAAEVGVKFDDIGALETVKETLQEVVMLPLRRPGLFRKGNLTKPTKGVLLFGPPGSGKTLSAKAVATEAGANFINITMSSIASKWFGEGEKYVRAVFTLAKKLSPSVIFVDEVDSMLGRRERPGEHEAMRKIKNEFMLQWDGLRSGDADRVLVLGSTNRPFDLDDAVLRRFPRRLMVDLPDADSRGKILRVITEKEDLSDDVDLMALAETLTGYSGSDLRNLCVSAAMEPVREIIAQEKQANNGEIRFLPSKAAEDEDINVRPLRMEDFTKARDNMSASVSEDAASVSELRKWNDTYGEGGSRRKTTLPYFM